MNKAILFFILVGVFSLTTVARDKTAKIDSLNKALANAENSSVRIDILHELIDFNIEEEDYNLALLNIEQGINEAKKIRNYSVQLSFIMKKANAYGLSGNQQKSEELINSAVADLDKSEDTETIDNWLKLAKVCENALLYSKAIYCYQQAEEIARATNNELLIAKIYGEIGILRTNNLGRAKSAIEAYKIALSIYEAEQDSLNIALTENRIGNAYIDLGEYTEAAKIYEKALFIFESLESQGGIARAYNNLGETYRYRGNYSQALENYLKSLKIGELLKDTLALSVYVNNIGIIYYEQGKYDEATRFFEQSLNFSSRVDFKPGLVETYNYLGLTYKKQGDFDKALETFKKSLDISRDFGDKVGQAFSYTSMGQLNTEKKFFDSAMLDFKRALELAQKSEDPKGQVQSLVGIARVYYLIDDYQQSIIALNKAVVLAERIDLKPVLIEAYKLLSFNYERLGNTKKALAFHKSFSELTDTLNNFRVSQRLDAMENAFLAESREREMQLLLKERELQRAQLQKNQMLLEKQEDQQRAVIIGSMLMLLFGIFFFFAYRERKRAFEKLRLQKQEIEAKSNDITASIEYAKIIQEAILTNKDYLGKVLNEYFVFYRPKDIVSGDFYWIYQSTRNKQIVAAVVDCTGHGVPGAFMSMIGISLLNEIVIKSRIRNTEAILNRMREEVIRALHQGDKNNQDGMDASILVLDREEKTLQFSGANSSLYLVRNEVIQEFKGDKQPIGYFAGEPMDFSKHWIDVQEGDSIYLSSDGYVDQFGGFQGKKFKNRNFRDLLVKLSEMSMKDQGMLIEQEHNNWKGDYEQLDDICVLGFRV